MHLNRNNIRKQSLARRRSLGERITLKFCALMEREERYNF